MADESDAVRESADSSGAESADDSSGVEQRAVSAHSERRAQDTPDEDERYRGATPPGYDWPTHGGYLGCLLGLMAAVLVAPLGYILFGFLGAFLARPLGGFGVAVAVIVTVGAYLALFVALTRLGWFMGKRFLREYEQPVRPVWGEDDDEDYPLVVEADPQAPAEASEASEAEEATRTPDASQAENAG